MQDCTLGMVLYGSQTKASLWEGGCQNEVVAENMVRNFSGYSGSKELSVQRAAFAWSSGAEEDAVGCAGLAGPVPARWL